MKAAVFTQYGAPDVLQIKDVEKPVPKDNEVLIKVHATSVNDWDWGLIQGDPFVIQLLIGLRKPKKVNIPGVDVAGVIEAVGKSVIKFKVGDEVYGDISESSFGAFAEYVCAHEEALIKKPANMSFEDAAALPHAAMLCMQGLIDKGHIQSGQQILINGAGGGVGTLGIQVAKMYDAEVTGVDSAEKLEMLSSMGFDHVIDYKKEDFTRNKKQYDLILDVKMNRPMRRYARSLKRGGRYITVGGSMSRILQVTMFGSLFSLFAKKHICVLALKPNKDLAYVNKLYEQSKIKPVIDGVYKLDELPGLMQYFGEAKHKGKIIISV